MLEKLIEYLKNLPEEEQKKLLDSLSKGEQVEEHTEQAKESTEREQEQTEEKRTNENVKEEEQTEEIEKEQEVDNVEENQEKTEELATDNPPAFQELLETKIELALIKLGIREDRVEAAKRLFKTEIHSLEDLEKLKELVKEFPEWQKAKKEQGAGFGANIQENGNSLTEEEKRLKAMGIDPRN